MRPAASVPVWRADASPEAESAVAKPQVTPGRVVQAAPTKSEPKSPPPAGEAPETPTAPSARQLEKPEPLPQQQSESRPLEQGNLYRDERDRRETAAEETSRPRIRDDKPKPVEEKKEKEKTKEPQGKYTPPAKLDPRRAAKSSKSGGAKKTVSVRSLQKKTEMKEAKETPRGDAPAQARASEKAPGAPEKSDWTGIKRSQGFEKAQEEMDRRQAGSGQATSGPSRREPEATPREPVQTRDPQQRAALTPEARSEPKGGEPKPDVKADPKAEHKAERATSESHKNEAKGEKPDKQEAQRQEMRADKGEHGRPERGDGQRERQRRPQQQARADAEEEPQEGQASE